MHIQLEHLGKRFGNEWIFKGVNYSFTSPGSYALLGANGSGKSTLLQVIAGAIMPSNGKANFILNGQTIEEENVFRHIAFCSPAMELIDDFTLLEQLNFHFEFKQTKTNLSVSDMVELLQLKQHQNKALKSYSSGMRQRVKLACALFADMSVLMLDEPCTNLDEKGINWYKEMIQQHCSEQLVLVASNTTAEYDFCKHSIHVHDYKS